MIPVLPTPVDFFSPLSCPSHIMNSEIDSHPVGIHRIPKKCQLLFFTAITLYTM